MTTAPLAMGPTDATLAVLTGAPDPAATSVPSTAADFLAAILQALAPTAGTAGQEGGDVPDTKTDASAGVDATAAAALGAVAVPAVLASALPAPAGATGAPAAGDGAAAVVPGHANVAPGAGGAPTGTTSDIRMPVYEAGKIPAAPVTSKSPTPAAAHTATAPGTDLSPTPPHARAGGSGADSGSQAQALDPTPQPAQSAPPAMTPTTAPHTAGHAVDATATAPTSHVTRQVFPEVTSLVTRGDGTHRITLTLKPEALGEVRVVMTVRDGAVHVRLAAGHEAQQSLLEGSHELTRLLEAAGASETRVVVRDLGPTATAATTGTDLSQGLGDSRPQDQHAGTRAHHPATDGTNDPRATRGATGANPPRSVEPVTRTRTAGVDVTM